MATIETNVVRIQRWVEAKQTNEQEMLKRLNRVFNNPLAYSQVRKVVVSALVQMKIEAIDRPGPVRDAINAEKSLAVWQKVPLSAPMYPLNRLGDLLAELTVRPNSFDINDLSELIRIIGTWVENGGGCGGVPKSLTEAFRPGDSSLGLTWEAAKNLIWDKATVRQREQRIINPELYHAIEVHVRGAWVPPKRGNPSGMQMFRVNRDDLCRKIDLLFGLLKGATISGTTTDTALVLEAWGYQHQLHAGYYLFPLATIAASLHHTLLEAGLALSLIGAIDNYFVGFYTTLTPSGGFPGELQSVGNILNAAERDQRNRHFIIWYEGNDTPAGCILWDKPSDVEASRQLVEGKGLLNHVRTLSQHPSKKEVAQYISQKANNLFRTLPVNFKSAVYG